MYRRPQYARRPRKYARKGKKLSKPLRRAMTQVAKKVISRRSEDKVAGVPVETDVLHNSGIASADCKPLVMQIPQGTSSNQRLGDRITPKSLRVRGMIGVNPEATFATSKEIYVRVMLLAQKDIKTGVEILASGVDAGALLRAGYGGTGDAITFTGVTNNLLMPVNTNLFRVYYDRQFKLDLCLTDPGKTTHCHQWSYTFTKKNLPASFTFDEGNGDWPNNFSPFVAIGYAYADGTAPDIVTTNIITNTWAQLAFEDN